ncbi:MAG TPA: hypothetical protein VFU64_02595 [Gaiellaceae bacterium]|nr:hypothetical protein [Gaiellaceae bacterium]
MSLQVHVIAGTIVMFGGNPATSALERPASIPEALWELFLGVYCTIWGFRRDAPILSGETASIAPERAPSLAGGAA